VNRRLAGAIAAGALAFIACAAIALRRSAPRETSCGVGFEARGGRCAVGAMCPSPLTEKDGACVPPELRVRVPAAHLDLAVADWEAEGKYPPASVDVGAFAIDAFEASTYSFHCATCPFPNAAVIAAAKSDRDLSRAKGSVSLEDAKTYCTARKGRLPTEHEWIRAATARSGANASLTRYPWGDTGAVCRRAAWGFLSPSRDASREQGACGGIMEGPDTVGAHAGGDSAFGIHDLAGNVAEWALAKDESGRERAVVKGGSYVSNVASELRFWWRASVDPSAREPWVGARCVYDDE